MHLLTHGRRKRNSIDKTIKKLRKEFGITDHTNIIVNVEKLEEFVSIVQQDAYIKGYLEATIAAMEINCKYLSSETKLLAYRVEIASMKNTMEKKK